MKQQKQTYTLIEILAVVVIIGILASLTLGVSRYVGDKNAETRTITTIKQLELALEECKAKFGFYPKQKSANKNCFNVDLIDEKDSGDQTDDQHKAYKDLFYRACDFAKIKKNSNRGNIVDGWKRPLYYTSDGKSFVIYSAGADGFVGPVVKEEGLYKPIKIEPNEADCFAEVDPSDDKKFFDNEEADDLGTF